MSIDKGELSAKVRSGSYLPQAILGVEIPKGKDKVRLLGIPTVTDRLLQQAVLQIITARLGVLFLSSLKRSLSCQSTGRKVVSVDR